MSETPNTWPPGATRAVPVMQSDGGRAEAEAEAEPVEAEEAESTSVSEAAKQLLELIDEGHKIGDRDVDAAREAVRSALAAEAEEADEDAQ